MVAEIENQNCKKSLLDEIHRLLQACKEMNKILEKVKSKEFSELDDLDSICEYLGMCPEMKAFFKDNFVDDPALSPKEHFKNGMRLGQEFFRIKEKQH